VLLKIAAFWDVSLCYWASSFQRFEGSQCLQNVQNYSSAPHPKEWRSFSLLVLRSKDPVNKNISFQFTQLSRKLVFLTFDDEKEIQAPTHYIWKNYAVMLCLPTVLCDCEALATLRFRHLCHHFMKPGDYEDISVSKILQFVQGAGLLNDRVKGLHKRSITVEVHGSLWCPTFRILFYVCPLIQD
jgi:hypothetical protein